MELLDELIDYWKDGEEVALVEMSEEGMLRNTTYPELSCFNALRTCNNA